MLEAPEAEKNMGWSDFYDHLLDNCELRGVLFIAEGELDVICEGRLGNTQGISDMTASRLQRHIFISYKGTL